MFRGQNMWEGEFPQLQVAPQCHIQEVFCSFLLPMQSIAETVTYPAAKFQNLTRCNNWFDITGRAFFTFIDNGKL